MAQPAILNMLETRRQNKTKSLNKEVESLSKEIEGMMKNKMEIFELKNIVTEAQEQKERVEERINELEDITIELTKWEQQRDSEMKQKNEQSLSGLWDYNKVSYIRVIRVSGERAEKVLEDIIVENLPKLSRKKHKPTDLRN